MKILFYSLLLGLVSAFFFSCEEEHDCDMCGTKECTCDHQSLVCEICGSDNCCEHIGTENCCCYTGDM